MVLREIGWEVVDKMTPIYGRDQWLALVSMIMTLQVPKKAKNFLTN
jgi:hypothetical protein